MEIEEKTLKKETVYHGRILSLRCDTALLPDGTTAPREVVEHNGGVGVVPLTEDGDVLLVEQFRYPYMEATLEIPAGKRDRVEEDPLLCGKRELREETGAVAREFRSLGKLYPSPGYCGEIIWMYLATGLTYGADDRDEDEFLNLVKMPLTEAVDMVMKGEIPDSKTQAALLKTYILMKNGELK